MITCPKCSSSNSDARRYCRECGSLIVRNCGRCGFGNGHGDSYCGGCGMNLSRPEEQTGQQPGQHIQTVPSSSRYSYEDLSDLIQEKTKKAPTKSKDMKGTDSVSQDMLDSIFEDSGD